MERRLPPRTSHERRPTTLGKTPTRPAADRSCVAPSSGALPPALRLKPLLRSRDATTPVAGRAARQHLVECSPRARRRPLPCRSGRSRPPCALRRSYVARWRSCVAVGTPDGLAACRERGLPTRRPATDLALPPSVAWKRSAYGPSRVRPDGAQRTLGCQTEPPGSRLRCSNCAPLEPRRTITNRPPQPAANHPSPACSSSPPRPLHPIFLCGPPSAKLPESARHRGALAQLVARFHGMEEVRGSNPLSSTASQRPFPG